MYFRLQVPSPHRLLAGSGQRLFVFFVGPCLSQMGREMHLSLAPFRNQVSLRCCLFCTMTDCCPSLTSPGISTASSCKLCAGHPNILVHVSGNLVPLCIWLVVDGSGWRYVRPWADQCISKANVGITSRTVTVPMKDLASILTGRNRSGRTSATNIRTSSGAGCCLRQRDFR